MKLVVRNTSGETVSLQISSDETFIGLKERVEEEAGISLDLKDIALKGKRVSEDQKVEEYFLAYANNVDSESESNSYCVVPGCSNTKSHNPEKVFFEFPEEEIRCHQWVMYCQRLYTGPGKHRLSITADSTICSDHFLPDQFVKNAHTLLKRTAIPSVKPSGFLCNDSEDQGSKDDKASSSDDDTLIKCAPRRLCRLCACSCPAYEMIMIFEKNENGLRIADKINLCLPIQVKATDPLPKQICGKCNHQLNELFQLADLCTIAQSEMLSAEEKNREKGKNKLCNVTLISGVEMGENVLLDRSVVGEDTGLSPENDLSHVMCPHCLEGEMNYTKEIVLNEPSNSPEENANFLVQNSQIVNGENKTNSPSIEIFSTNESTSDVIEFRKESIPEENNFVSKESIFISEMNSENLVICKTEVEDINIDDITCETEPDDTYADIMFNSESPFSKNPLDTSDFTQKPGNSKQDLPLDSDASYPVKTADDSGEHEKEKSDTFTEEYFCRICSFKFKTIKAILKHSYMHSHNGFYQCSVCVTFYTNKTDMMSHLDKHEEMRDFQSASDNSHNENGHKIIGSKSNSSSQQDSPLASDGLSDGNTCLICKKNFRSESRLKFHMQFHNTKTPNYCEICDKSFPDELKLYKHSIYVHNSTKGHVCEECGKIFKSEASMRFHQRSFHTETIFKPYTCERCGKAFIRKSMLMNHMQSSHKQFNFETSCFTCKLCHEAFPSTTSAVAHMDNQHKMECMDESTYSFDMLTLTRMFVCEFCERCFAEGSVLNLHRDKHPNDTPYECKICELPFASSEEAKSHRKIHKNKEIPVEYQSEFLIPNTYLCEYCERCFLNYVKYSEHLTVHYGREPYQCRQCDTKFSSLEQALQHRPQHGETNYKAEELNFYRPYECHYCSKSFAIEDALIKHIRMHTGEKPFVCSQCGKGFSQSSGLYTHQKVHSSLRPYECPICPRTFKIKGDRDVHVRKHSGDRPYKCEFCGKAFMTQHVYSQHRKIHTGERPYKCDVCGIAFRRSHVLTVHKRIHTGEKPNICDICGKRYRQKGDMLKHRRIQHGV